MSWTLAEGLVDQVKSYLESNLPARLDLLDTEYGDFILEDLTSVEISERDLRSQQSYPVGIVMVDRTGIPQWTGAAVWGHHDLTIGILVLDQDLTDLRKRLYRYGRAVLEELADAHGDGGITFEIGVGEIEITFSPIFTDPDSQFIADVQVTAPVVLKESR